MVAPFLSPTLCCRFMRSFSVAIVPDIFHTERLPRFRSNVSIEWNGENEAEDFIIRSGPPPIPSLHHSTFTCKLNYYVIFLFSVAVGCDNWQEWWTYDGISGECCERIYWFIFYFWWSVLVVVVVHNWVKRNLIRFW